MKLGVLVTSVGNFGIKGFYNSQEIGLAKELDKLFEAVIIYKLIPENEPASLEKIEGCEHTQINFVPSKNYGINGLIDLKQLDTSIDTLVYFSDTQLVVPKVYKWCKTHGIKMIPYIGVLESHSENVITKIIINALFKRNIAVYKKCECLVKNPQVENVLKTYGIKRCIVSPVGLDLSILNTGYKTVDPDVLKEKWGFAREDKVLLFIGRLVPEKQPLMLINIFKRIQKVSSDYRLLIVGQGELYTEVNRLIKDNNLESFVKLIDKVPNTTIWELYRLSEAFINLNQQEIFGMAILEAMYYGCKVVAWEAPGPSYIIEDNVSGYLVSNEKEIIDAIYKPNNMLESVSHERIIECFTWKNTAEKIYLLAKK
ncbi:glycosyltransferase [Peribacillus frigoritolerans]|uniref:glycosyltransferase n=1 Tax=Peribacillus frigoritolerans TaxID=450367 RepID=UPI0039A2311E